MSLPEGGVQEGTCLKAAILAQKGKLRPRELKSVQYLSIEGDTSQKTENLKATTGEGSMEKFVLQKCHPPGLLCIGCLTSCPEGRQQGGQLFL